MKIIKIECEKIFNTHAQITLLVNLVLHTEQHVSVEIPYINTEHNELESVIKILETVANKVILGNYPSVVDLDLELVKYNDELAQKKLKPSLLFGLSMAVCKAQALIENIPLFDLIAQLYGAESIALPYPLINICQYEFLKKSNTIFSQIMLIPLGAQSFTQGFNQTLLVIDKFFEYLEKIKESFAVQNTDFEKEKLLLSYVKKALVDTDSQNICSIAFATNLADFYDKQDGNYFINGKKVTSGMLLELYQDLYTQYGIFSIEDGMAFTDTKGCKDLFEKFGADVQIVLNKKVNGNSKNIITVLENQIANAVVVEPYQVGTITQVFESVAVCKNAGMNPLISHSNQETNEQSNADLSVGISSGQIKIGDYQNKEHFQKIKRLISIEDILTMDMLETL